MTHCNKDVTFIYSFENRSHKVTKTQNPELVDFTSYPTTNTELYVTP